MPGVIHTTKCRFEADGSGGYPTFSSYTIGPSSGWMSRWQSRSLGGITAPGSFFWSNCAGNGPGGITYAGGTVYAAINIYQKNGTGLQDLLIFSNFSCDGGQSFHALGVPHPLPLVPTLYTADITTEFVNKGANPANFVMEINNGDSLFQSDPPPGWQAFMSDVGLILGIGIPVLPISVAGQFFSPLLTPTRGPGWSVKKTPVFSSIKQQAVTGKTYVIPQRNCPLSKFEFTFQVLSDDPRATNPFYTAPITGTDLESLTGFYTAMQGAGDFAYQPPDHFRGGVFSVSAVQVKVNGLAICSSTASITNLKLGDILTGSGFTTATYLNGHVGTVVNINYALKTITLQITTGGTHSFATDTGTLTGGQPLANADSNIMTEIVNTTGSYSPILLTSSITQIREPVQLIDTASLIIYDGTGTSVSYTLMNATDLGSCSRVDSTINQYYPYQGLVVQFSSPPTPPISCQYSYYYPCRFSEDTQEYENFMALLYSLSSVKIEQVRY